MTWVRASVATSCCLPLEPLSIHMRLAIQHITRYSYSEPLKRAVQQLFLWPSNGVTQVIDAWDVSAPAPIQTTVDGLGNLTGHFTLDSAACELTLTAAGAVETLGLSEWTEGASQSSFESDSESVQATEPGVHPAFYLRSGKLSGVTPRITTWAQGIVQTGTGSVVVCNRANVLRLATAVYNKVAYQQGMTDVKTLAIEAFDSGAGVCQDQAHIMLAACRGLGWPARYVSGYLYAPNQPELASHAWVDVCMHVDPTSWEARWLSVDITQACLTTDQYVRLAVGTDYSSCAPSKGMRVGGGIETMSVDVTIQQL